jgi:hypothetical protein
MRDVSLACAAANDWMASTHACAVERRVGVGAGDSSIGADIGRALSMASLLPVCSWGSKSPVDAGIVRGKAF